MYREGPVPIKTWVDLTEVAYADFDRADAEELKKHIQPPLDVVYSVGHDKWFLIQGAVD